MVKITWYGTAAVMIETNENRIVFDPFMKDLPEGDELPSLTDQRRAAFHSVENIVITHGHLDHLASVCALYANRSCSVFASNSPLSTLRSQGFAAEKLRLIEGGDVLEFSDLSIQAFPGKHIQYDWKIFAQLLQRIHSQESFLRLVRLSQLNRHYPENKETLFFEIRADGKRIQLMGSADLLADVDYPVGADVLILPHQGRSDIDRHNSRLVRQLRPRRVLVDHYDDAFPPISSFVPVDSFCREMSKDIPTEKLIEGVPCYV